MELSGVYSGVNKLLNPLSEYTYFCISWACMYLGLSIDHALQSLQFIARGFYYY